MGKCLQSLSIMHDKMLSRSYVSGKLTPNNNTLKLQEDGVLQLRSRRLRHRAFIHLMSGYE